MVFDPSEFEGPGFFHTISEDLTEQNAPFCVLLKKKIRGGGDGKPRPPTAFSLSGLACMGLFIIHLVIGLI
jgi:hypothetical protein